MKKIKFGTSCAFCEQGHGQVKVYRDPFGTALAPGRWPNLTMHADCFLAYLRKCFSAGPLTSQRTLDAVNPEHQREREGLCGDVSDRIVAAPIRQVIPPPSSCGQGS
jgi:hypothetical protein